MKQRTQKLSMQLLLDVEVEYDLLPAQENLPEQVDVKKVVVITTNDEKPRKVNVLGALDESALVNLEDDILEAHGS